MPNTDGRVGGSVRRGTGEKLILCPPPCRLGSPDSQFVAKQHFLAASRAPLRRGRGDRWRLLLTWLKLKMRLVQDHCCCAGAARNIGVVARRLDGSPAFSVFFPHIFSTKRMSRDGRPSRPRAPGSKAGIRWESRSDTLLLQCCY